MNRKIERAVILIGGQNETARLITQKFGKKVYQSMVNYWIKTERLPAKYAQILSDATNGKYSRHDLCPEIFDKDD